MKARKWLTELRLMQGLSQEKVAETVGISKSVYSRIESGIRNPGVATAQKIAACLGFQWTLFFGSDVTQQVLDHKFHSQV